MKPGRLNEAEIQIMRAHSIVGAELLAKSNMAQMQMAEEIARYHHEWWNGNGYPAAISGTAIPLSARITALADVFDALTHKRPYKDAWPIEDALAEIASLSGRQFDPELCHLFLRLIADLQKQHGDLDVFLGQAAKRSSFLQARSKIWTALAQSRSSDVQPFGDGSSGVSVQ
jgi:putative two-component system response regulator